jgi:Ca2+-transporting ATPase
MDGVDLTQNPCHYFTVGKTKASTLSLTVLVMIEMLNALNAISEDNSLLRISPLVNPYLLVAIAGSVGLHIMILYLPAFAKIFGIAPLNV